MSKCPKTKASDVALQLVLFSKLQLSSSLLQHRGQQRRAASPFRSDSAVEPRLGQQIGLSIFTWHCVQSTLFTYSLHHCNNEFFLFNISQFQTRVGTYCVYHRYFCPEFSTYFDLSSPESLERYVQLVKAIKYN